MYGDNEVVVPGYYLVWYNLDSFLVQDQEVVVPGYYLVWYNREHQSPHIF